MTVDPETRVLAIAQEIDLAAARCRDLHALQAQTARDLIERTQPHDLAPPLRRQRTG